MFAREIMTPRPVTGTPEMTLDRVAAILRRNRFRHLPVIRDGRLYGVISDRDVQRVLAAGTPGITPIEAYVHSPAITATSDTPVEHVARLLQENKIGCVPVVTDSVPPAIAGAADAIGNGTGDVVGVETVVGIVTESDIFETLIQAIGVMEPGSRVVIRLERPLEDMLAAALALHEAGAQLLSLRTEPVPAGSPGQYAVAQRELRLVIRINTITPASVIWALQRQGLRVEFPTLQPSSPWRVPPTESRRPAHHETGTRGSLPYSDAPGDGEWIAPEALMAVGSQ